MLGGYSRQFRVHQLPGHRPGVDVVVARPRRVVDGQCCARETARDAAGGGSVVSMPAVTGEGLKPLTIRWVSAALQSGAMSKLSGAHITDLGDGEPCASQSVSNASQPTSPPAGGRSADGGVSRMPGHRRSGVQGHSAQREMDSMQGWCDGQFQLMIVTEHHMADASPASVSAIVD